MVIGRRVAKRKGQQLIALPPEVRGRMGVIPGQWLYFHLGRKGEVVLSTSPARAGGKPPTAGLEVELARARAQITELERRLAALPGTLFAEWAGQQILRRMKVQLTGVPALDAINDRLRDIEAQLGVRRAPWSYRAKRGGGGKGYGQVETVEAPVLKLPPGVVAVEIPPPDPDPSSS